MNTLAKRLLPYLLMIPIVFTADPISAGEAHGHAHDQAQEHRQHDAHVHGTARLNLALDGDAIIIEFESPAANIVGFEHAPSSSADHAAVDGAVAALKDGDHLFRFNSAAGCRLHDAEIASALIDTGHDEHTHADHDAHAPGTPHQDKGHADFLATYHFECTAPGRLRQLQVGLFDAFATTERIQVQFVLGDRQGATELHAAHQLIEF